MKPKVYLVIDKVTGDVANRIVWDGLVQFDPGQGMDLIPEEKDASLFQQSDVMDDPYDHLDDFSA